jgi:hypothetical protein
VVHAIHLPKSVGAPENNYSSSKGNIPEVEWHSLLNSSC